tara:strand:- start:424 stop:819 length:396 start_codon:yes stop_codon:yes gene_type:complete
MPGLDKLTHGCLDAANAACVTPAARVILLLLCGYSDSRGRGWPKVSTLSERGGVAVRTVRRVLRELESVGLVEIDLRPGRASVYFLTPRVALSRVQELPPEPVVHHRGPAPDPGEWSAGFSRDLPSGLSLV